MDEQRAVAAYLRGHLWPEQEGFTFTEAMLAEIEARCAEMAAEILALLERV
jgi:hypothetical protein